MADSSSTDDVAAFLAQRKARKAGAGGARFKTFSAAQALVAETQGDNGNAQGPHGETGRSAHSAAVTATVADTFVQGEWVDEDTSSGPSRLLVSGNVIDLNSLTLEEKQKADKEEQQRKPAYPVRQPPPDLSTSEPQRTTFSAARKAQMDFPSLGSASNREPSASTAAARPAPPSVWGNRPVPVAAPAPVQQEEPEPAPQPQAPAPEAKPGVWRPRSVGAATTTARSAVPPPAAAPAAPSAAASDGLRKTANPWRPRGAGGPA